MAVVLVIGKLPFNDDYLAVIGDFVLSPGTT